jgi:alpha-L-rhamnosidase
MHYPRTTCRRAVATAVALVAALSSLNPSAGARQPRVTPSLEELFLTPPDDSRIMMRWWWFGPSATDEEIDRETARMKEGGIGGFEVAVVYPMTVDDAQRGLHNYPYLSTEFLERFGHAARRARELGMRMDVTLGSGWSFGGPHITPDLASTRLRTERREITPDVKSAARPVPYEHERLIAAFIGRGSIREVDPGSFKELDLSGNGPLGIPPGAGPRTLLFYFSSPTGQTVKRAALGAEGYVLDHFSRAAIEKHLHEVGDKLVAAAGRGGIHAIFCDSLEVYDANWTSDMLDQFRARRGYDLRPLLPLIDYDAGPRSQQLRRDFGRTLTELYEERFLQPVAEWSRRNDVLFRIQGYGQPPAALASYRYADLPDGEGFEWRTLSRLRWAASAAHLLNRPLVGSETWTWVHSPAFRATPLDLKAEADLHFLSGVNQLIGHGWPYSPAQVKAPGWPFYAAGALNDKNPWWPVMADVAAYLQRVSFLLRQGQPVADIAVYAPADEARAAMRPGASDYQNLWMAIRDQIGPAIVPAILDAGYNFDLIDDRTLADATARHYKVVVLSGVKSMPEATSDWLAAYVREGGTVVAVGRAPDGRWSSLQAVRDGDLPGRLAAAIAPDVSVTGPQVIGSVHRRLADRDIYFLVNTSNVPRDGLVRFRSRTSNAELWDPMTGTIERVPAGAGDLSLHFDPYSSRVVVFRNVPSSAALSQARSRVTSMDLRTGWTISVGGTQGLPAALPHSWLDQPATRYFSGAITYRRRLDQLPARAQGARIVLEFGDAKAIDREPLPDGTMRGNSFAALLAPPIREAASVFVNQRRVGSVWAPPYRIDITDHLHDGANDLAIEVYNTAINELAEGGRLPDVSAVVERYGQRFRLQDLDDLRPLPSGILAVPRLVVER